MTSACQEILRILWNSNGHYFIRKSPSPVPTLSQINPIHASLFHFLKIHFISSSHLHLVRPIGLFYSGLHIKILYAPLLSPIRATCSAHLILLDLTNRIIFGGDYTSQSPSLCSLLHTPVTSSSQAQLSSSTPYSQTPSACVPPSI